MKKGLSLLLIIAVLCIPVSVYAASYASVQLLYQHKGIEAPYTELDGHNYRVVYEVDEAEETNLYYLTRDGKDICKIQQGGGYSEIVVLGKTLYLSAVDVIYRLDGNTLVELAEVGGYIHQMVTNGKDLYVSTGEHPGNSWTYDGYECDFYKVTPKGVYTLWQDYLHRL